MSPPHSSSASSSSSTQSDSSPRPSLSNHLEPTPDRDHSDPTRPPIRSFSITSLSQNAYYHLYRSLPSSPRFNLPLHPTSIVNLATSDHSKHEIITIAIKKLLVVFTSVHTVISTSSLILALIRWKRAISRGESRSLWIVLKTVWSDSSITRLAAFLGSYSALWTLTYPALLKFGKNDSAQLPITNLSQSKFSNLLLRAYQHKLQQFLARWAAALSGAVAGLALLAQVKQERINLATNIFCRGLYTIFKYRPLIKLPCEDLLLFGISNAQIMSAFVLHPQTLPSWYWHWIRRVGNLDVKFLELHRLLNLNKLQDSTLIEKVIERTRPRTAGNEQRIKNWLSRPDSLRIPFAPCHFNHPSSDSCLVGNGIRTWGAFKSMLPTYVVLHLVPTLLFRSKVLIKSPTSFFISIARKTISSALFLATFVWIILFSVCIPCQVYEYSRGRIRLRGTRWNAIIGFATTLSLLWEDPRRRGELALYCAPKALTSMWYVLKTKGIVKSIKYGEMALASAGTAMLMHCFVHAPQSMPALIRGIISQLTHPHLPGRLSLTGQGKMPENDVIPIIDSVDQAEKDSGATTDQANYFEGLEEANIP